MSGEQFAALGIKFCYGIIALAAAYVVMIAALWLFGKVAPRKPRRYFKIPREYLK